MEYIKINEAEYPATIYGKIKDSDWDGRSTKTITLSMSYADAINLFIDGSKWSIISEEVINENGQDVITRQEFNNDDYNLAGPITDMRDGTLLIKMGKLTELEEAYQLLYGGVDSDE